METIGDMDSNIIENIKYDFIKNEYRQNWCWFKFIRRIWREENSEFDMKNGDKNITYNKESKNTLKE